MGTEQAKSIAVKSTAGGVLRVLWVTMLLNILGAVFKLVVGLLSGNLTVLSDAMHGFLDAANNIIGLVAIKVAWRPPDANHPYGHRKFEALAALGIGALMTLTSWEVLRTIVRRFLLSDAGAAAPPRDAPIFVAAVVAGLVINVFVSRYEARRGRELGSTFLVADAAHTRTDIMVTLGSLSSLLLAPYVPVVDGLLALTIVGAILHTGWKILRDNTLLLTDAAQMDPEPVRQTVEGVAGVENCHAIRTHGMPDDVHLDLHIVVRPDMTAAETHAVEGRVRDRLFEQFPHVTEVSIHHQTEMPVTQRPIIRPPDTPPAPDHGEPAPR